METCRVLPAETVCHILRYSNPRDVVRWRAVSKWFCAITYEASIWKDLYANSRLPRPPGPFSSQSAKYLEQALVRTEKLAHSWMTRPMRYTSYVEFRAKRQPMGPIKLLGGRWIVLCESATRFVLYDVYPNVKPRRQVIWEHEEPVESWDTCSVTSEQGWSLVYVLLSHEDPDIPFWRLLELRMNDKSDQLQVYDLTELDVPLPKHKLGRKVELQSGSSPFLYISAQNLVFDTRTRTFYDFPKFRFALQERRDHIRSWHNTFRTPTESVVLTKTHIITLSRYMSPEGLRSLKQVFMIPADGSLIQNNRGVLRLSHEGSSYQPFDWTVLLRNSVVDPVTGSTNIRLLELCQVEEQLNLVCEDLMLPQSSGDDVLPITFSTALDEVIEESDKTLDKTLSGPCYVDCSDDGHLRGFYTKRCSSIPRLGEPIMKFTVDATQDGCKITFGELLLPEWDHIKDTGYVSIVSFDGARGRLFSQKYINRDEVQVIIVDVE